MNKSSLLVSTILLSILVFTGRSAADTPWLLLDDFETQPISEAWINIDAQNETKPFLAEPQITKHVAEPSKANHYLLKKPAADGILGNRKAITVRSLPRAIAVGETYTIYTRVLVESFPNNHSFGLSNVDASDVAEQGYDAFEPMIRITDKAESDGYQNDGTLMVLSGYKSYSKIIDPTTEGPAKPMQSKTWYEIWAVINNAPRNDGGQTYDLYVRGGQFSDQQLVFSDAVFRMQREAPLTLFMAICNTGPHKQPYGNGGLGYDDIHMAPGKVLSTP